MKSLSSSKLKKLVYIFNVVIFICGAVVFGLGIWSVVDNVGLFTLLNNVMLAAVYMLIIGGAVVMIVAFLGCYGGYNESKKGIIVFCIIALLAACLKIIGCIIIYSYYVQSADYLAGSYKTLYGVNQDTDVTEIWDKTQNLGSCCGWFDYLDWKKSDFYNETLLFPSSCCVQRENQNRPTTDLDALSMKNCQSQRPGFIHERGCVHVLRTFYYAIGLTTIFIIILELVSIVLIVAFYQRIP